MIDFVDKTLWSDHYNETFSSTFDCYHLFFNIFIKFNVGFFLHFEVRHSGEFKGFTRCVAKRGLLLSVRVVW